MGFNLLNIIQSISDTFAKALHNPAQEQADKSLQYVVEQIARGRSKTALSGEELQARCDDIFLDLQSRTQGQRRNFLPEAQHMLQQQHTSRRDSFLPSKGH